MASDIHPHAIASLVNGDHGAPFELLGPHASEDGKVSIRAFRPTASKLQVVVGGKRHKMKRLHDDGFFEVTLAGPISSADYHFEADTHDGQKQTFHDPYAFGPMITDYDLYLFGEGRLLFSYDKLGAHSRQIDGVWGVNFAVWAPNAYKVSVVGDFNNWDSRVHPMRLHVSGGVWEIFIPEAGIGSHYKYEIRSRELGYRAEKADPYGFWSEQRPKTASIVADLDSYQWNDEAWMKNRAQQDPLRQPMSIYEVHLGSWKKKDEGRYWLSYRELADELIEYVKDVGYTHIELMPVAEHPFDASWGYQVTGYYAPTTRFGNPDDFMYFVDKCHQAGIGIILDWVPAHFPKDGYALSYFDGTHLYSHKDSRQGEHPDWGTYIFNYGRHEVRNFLISNALFWLKKYHIDGLRVDAVSSMLYLDFGRKEGEWIPNEYGSNENLPAISFMKEFNTVVHAEAPGAVTIAEESTAWPMVSRPTFLGGLGFTFKWNMGWMHDVLQYLSKDPIHRRWHHNDMTFSLMYAFTENFVLSLSHDEVVHGKGSLMGKASGDWWQKFATLRTLFGFQYTHPGKKLNFMGQDFGQWREWSEARSLDWHLLQFPTHDGLIKWMRDLNRLYKSEPALWEQDFEPEGFEWIEANDADNSVFSYIRFAEDRDDFLVVVCNFTPVPRLNYRIGVPKPGYYRELLNSDAAIYNGSNVGNNGGVWADHQEWNYRPYSLNLTIPPLACLILKL